MACKNSFLSLHKWTNLEWDKLVDLSWFKARHLLLLLPRLI
jgi:hypothetical protein